MSGYFTHPYLHTRLLPNPKAPGHYKCVQHFVVAPYCIAPEECSQQGGHCFVLPGKVYYNPTFVSHDVTMHQFRYTSEPIYVQAHSESLGFNTSNTVIVPGTRSLNPCAQVFAPKFDSRYGEVKTASKALDVGHSARQFSGSTIADHVDISDQCGSTTRTTLLTSQFLKPDCRLENGGCATTPYDACVEVEDKTSRQRTAVLASENPSTQKASEAETPVNGLCNAETVDPSIIECGPLKAGHSAALSYPSTIAYRSAQSHMDQFSRSVDILDLFAKAAQPPPSDAGIVTLFAQSGHSDTHAGIEAEKQPSPSMLTFEAIHKASASETALPTASHDTSISNKENHQSIPTSSTPTQSLVSHARKQRKPRSNPCRPLPKKVKSLKLQQSTVKKETYRLSSSDLVDASYSAGLNHYRDAVVVESAGKHHEKEVVTITSSNPSANNHVEDPASSVVIVALTEECKSPASITGLASSKSLSKQQRQVKAVQVPGWTLIKPTSGKKATYLSASELSAAADAIDAGLSTGPAPDTMFKLVSKSVWAQQRVDSQMTKPKSTRKLKRSIMTIQKPEVPRIEVSKPLHGRIVQMRQNHAGSSEPMMHVGRNFGNLKGLVDDNTRACLVSAMLCRPAISESKVLIIHPSRLVGRLSQNVKSCHPVDIGNATLSVVTHSQIPSWTISPLTNALFAVPPPPVPANTCTALVPYFNQPAVKGGPVHTVHETMPSNSTPYQNWISFIQKAHIFRSILMLYLVAFILMFMSSLMGL